MTNTILVPTDFSECSINAIKYAANLARKISNTNLLIAHAYSLPITYGEAGLYSPVVKITDQMEEEIKMQFEKMERQVPELNEVSFQTVSFAGFVTEMVESLCPNNEIDMIVMGTKGASGIDEVLLGTNTNSVVRSINIPTIVIPENAHYKAIRNIALASDYKPIDGKVLDPLKKLIKITKGDLHIIHIGDKDGISSTEATVAKKFVQFFKNIPHHFHYIVNEDVETGLNEYIIRKQIDLLALIPRKHKFFDMIFGKSESRRIIFHTKTPVITLPS
ncbi:MAG TPA: universal stress protein [Fulvivirga sp.]|nr:universal stress protein [Fulvivirga sp.]